MKREPIDINKPTNLIYMEVKRKLEDSKTIFFIVVLLVNVFCLGLLLAEYRQLQRDYEDLQDKHGVTQVMINKLRGQLNE
jgi:hypothetical protein